MAATRTPTQPTEWMANGFPPRSFPPEDPGPQAAPPPEGPPAAAVATAPPVAATAPPRRGRWVAPLAALIALLLLAAGLLLATRGGDDDSRVATGTSTTEAGAPAFEEPTTSVAPPSSIEPVIPTTAPFVPSTAPTTAPPAVLETSLTTLTIPNVDTTAGPQTGRLTLSNRGRSPLTFSTQPSTALLAASPARGTIPPGGATDITVTLDGSRAATEGPFNGTLSIGGNGGTKVVQVASAIGRPPQIADDVGERCAVVTNRCSRQIKLAPPTQPDPSPCNTPWAYAVRISDQSRVQVTAVARVGLGNADTPLTSAAAAGGRSDIFISRPMAPLPALADLRFFIEAVDQHGFRTRLAEQVISC